MFKEIFIKTDVTPKLFILLTYVFSVFLHLYNDLFNN